MGSFAGKNISCEGVYLYVYIYIYNNNIHEYSILYSIASSLLQPFPSPAGCRWLAPLHPGRRWRPGSRPGEPNILTEHGDIMGLSWDYHDDLTTRNGGLNGD